MRVRVVVAAVAVMVALFGGVAWAGGACADDVAGHATAVTVSVQSGELVVVLPETDGAPVTDVVVVGGPSQGVRVTAGPEWRVTAVGGSGPAGQAGRSGASRDR